MIAFPQPAQTENALLVPLLPCRILSKLLKELHQANSSFPPSAEGDSMCEHSVNGGSSSSEVRGVYLYCGRLNPDRSSSHKGAWNHIWSTKG